MGERIELAGSPTTVYTLRDANSAVLYVGMSGNVAKRLHSHSHHSPWWPEVARVDFEQLPHRLLAAARERELIRGLLPVHNVMHKPRIDGDTVEFRFRPREAVAA